MHPPSKPLEPGCLALVISNQSRFDNPRPGQVVQVLRRATLSGNCVTCGRHDWWEIDLSPPYGCSCALMRIDPDEETKADTLAEREADLIDAIRRVKELLP